MSLSFLANVLHLLLLSCVLQRVAAVGGTDNGSSSYSPNHLVINLIGRYTKLGFNYRDPDYSQPPDEIMILPNNWLPSFQPKLNLKILQFCPLPKSDNRAIQIFKHDKLLEYCLFQINDDRFFCEDEVRPYLTKVGLDSKMGLCLHEDKGQWYKMESKLCFPFVKGEKNSIIYKKGIKGFLDYANQDVENTISEVHSYLICYNKEQNRTEWAERWVKPDANLQHSYDTEIAISTDGFDLEAIRFEKMRKAFEEQDKTSPDAMVPQMLVPKEENSYLLWKINTSHYINVAPLWKSLVPLMNLINERVALIANRINKPLLVKTYPFHEESIENAAETYLDEDKEILIPNIWLISMYEPNSKSGITVVLHNTPNEPPKSNEMCKEAASCSFQKWISTSTKRSFGDVTDEHIGYAYCCKMVKFDEGIIENVIDINLEWKKVQNRG